MSSPVLLPGANAENAFNLALNAAYSRAMQPGKTYDEPHFVRELISIQTLNDLNAAASNTYDSSANVIRFAGAFIHGTPWAKFTALNGASSKACRRELADAVVMLNKTEPDFSGVHQITSRMACLLMFKTKDAQKPKCPRYDHTGLTSPSDGDQDQFHLFSSWPQFDLEDSSCNPLGSYFIKQPAGSPNEHSHGKFAALWSPTTKKPNPWFDKWRYANPKPSENVTDSLGHLLRNMVDTGKNDGREYDTAGPSDWDKLIATLNTFSISHSWGGAIRSANPAGLSFLQVQSILDTSLGTVAQHVRSMLTPGHLRNPHLAYALEDIHDLNRRFNSIDYSADVEGIPILSITVSSFRCPEYTEPLTPESRSRLFNTALNDIWTMTRSFD